MVFSLESKSINCFIFLNSFFFKRNYQRRIQQLNAIRVIQRNGRALMKVRNWSWWRLFTKLKPLLEVEKIEELKNEIKRLKAEVDTCTTQKQETEQKLQQVQEERNTLNKRCIDLDETVAELDKVNYFNRKNFFLFIYL